MTGLVINNLNEVKLVTYLRSYFSLLKERGCKLCGELVM